MAFFWHGQKSNIKVCSHSLPKQPRKQKRFSHHRAFAACCTYLLVLQTESSHCRRKPDFGKCHLRAVPPWASYACPQSSPICFCLSALVLSVHVLSVHVT